MTVSPRNVNHYHACMAFVFQNDEERKVIHVVRYLSAICTYPQVNLDNIVKLCIVEKRKVM